MSALTVSQEPDQNRDDLVRFWEETEWPEGSKAVAYATAGILLYLLVDRWAPTARPRRSAVNRRATSTAP
ncbi:hypothetical protein GCM10010398_42450 [Streptomyces fimbriatus]